MNSNFYGPKKNDDDLLAFASALVASYPHDRLISGEETMWALQWLRRGNLTDPTQQTAEGWAQDLRALHLYAHDGMNLDQARTAKVAQYIWTQEGAEPDYQQLKDWLEAEDKAAQLVIEDKLSQSREDKNLQRTTRKIRRKKRR